jgi:hypothetical protein
MAMYNLSSHLSAKGLGQTFNGFPGSLETKAASGENTLGCFKKALSVCRSKRKILFRLNQRVMECDSVCSKAARIPYNVATNFSFLAN